MNGGRAGEWDAGPSCWAVLAVWTSSWRQVCAPAQAEWACAEGAAGGGGPQGWPAVVGSGRKGQVFGTGTQVPRGARRASGSAQCRSVHTACPMPVSFLNRTGSAARSLRHLEPKPEGRVVSHLSNLRGKWLWHEVTWARDCSAEAAVSLTGPADTSARALR